MILVLLLQLGFAGFEQEILSASLRLGVRPPQVMMSPVDKAHAKRMAWGPICQVRRDCPPATVYIATDVAAIAPRAVLRYLAYHEVCHVKLGHLAWEGGYLPPDYTQTQVDTCMLQVLGVQAKVLKWEKDVWGERELRPLRARRFGEAAYK